MALILRLRLLPLKFRYRGLLREEPSAQLLVKYTSSVSTVSVCTKKERM
jgi:hypothetical protein